MSAVLRVTSRIAMLAAGSAGITAAQSYVSTPGQIPSGSPFNSGYTENVDFSDIDHDGDRDMVKADGGDSGDDQSRLWINRGFESGGTIGFFVDRTATQLPSIVTSGRDLDFVDIDDDGDDDLYVSNTSAVSNQSNRWWINMGGAQGGTAGFFQDQTSTRWVNIAVNNGTTTFSSVAPSVALGSGGFVDWSCDCVFGDLDNDGDEDLFHSTYGGIFGGGVPSRIFRNDGAGFFEEFNPSGIQLSGTNIPNGTAAIWAQGTHQHNTFNTTGAQADIADTPLGAELGDLDGDLDLDVLHGARNETPRIFRNRLTDTGSLVAFRDLTHASGHTAFVSGGANYEQELGDFENDDDLDIYGLNWPSVDDCTVKNDGTGSFTSGFALPGSGDDDNEGDFLDYDNDGRLDIYVANFSGQDRLYRNDGPPNWTHTLMSSELPTEFWSSLGMDSCDVDNDGDYDCMIANDFFAAEQFFKNVNNIADAIAPRLAFLEQVPNRASGPAPTVVRVHVYDNASWDVTRYDTLTIEHSWNGGTHWYSSPADFAGGQIFRGTIRGDVAGTIQYRARCIDEHGNVGVSAIKSYTATGCTGNVVTYCTAGTSTNNCVPVISGLGTPSATAASGFTISITAVEGQKTGLIFYGVFGRVANVWKVGSSSYMCVANPVQRMPSQSSGGNVGACNGVFSEDWNAYMSSHPASLGAPLAVGQVIDAQAWYRDPPAPGTTNLSGALEFLVCN